MNKIKSIAIVVVSILNIFNVLAQTTEKTKFNFIIKDIVNNTPIGSVSCRVYSPEENIRTYAISDYNGCLSVLAYQDEQLTFSIIGYKSVTKRVSECRNDSLNEIFLVEEAVEIKEISVKAAPIIVRNDTIVYNVRSFTSQGDEHLEDVLKKLPGIKVAENGAVSYQGKSINKLYIDGKDLLGDNYRFATRNMPIEAVSAVEVLEYHQPVKMLRGKKYSDNAALNLKIDKAYKSVPFGEAKMGIGTPWIKWDNALFLTQLLENNQILITGKMNNIGEMLSAETRESIDVADIDKYEPNLQSVTQVQNANGLLPQNRYVHNRSFSVGGNISHSFSADAMLRANVTFWVDSSAFDTYHNYTYGGQDTITEEVLRNLQQKDKAFQSVFKYELNSINKYISDEVKYQITQTHNTDETINNGAYLNEYISQKPWYVQNYFSAAFPHNDVCIQINSLVRYSVINERLTSVSDSVVAYNVAEKFKSQSLVAKNIVATNILLWNNLLTLRGIAYYKHNTYNANSAIYHDNMRIVIEPSYAIAYGTDNYVSLSIPLKWEMLSAKGNASIERMLCCASPNIYFKQCITDKWQFVLSGAISKSGSDIGFRAEQPLRTSYNGIVNQPTDLFFSASKFVSARVLYRNLATLFFWNIITSYSDICDEYYNDFEYTNLFTTKNIVIGTNHRKILNINASSDKNIIDAGLSLKINFDYSSTKYLLSQQDVITDNNSHIFSVGLDVDFKKFDRFRLQTKTTSSIFWEQNDYQNSDRLKSLDSNITARFFFSKNIDVKFAWENRTSELSPNNYKNYNLADANISYNINKHWKISTAVMNIFNVQAYSITQNAGISNYKNSLSTREREFLVRAIVKF